MSKLVLGNLEKNISSAAVIMAGGSGTRFWPLSRRLNPKQFQPLADDGKSLIAKTAERLSSLNGSSVLVVTAADQAALAHEHLPNACVLAEPSAKNTAPCIGLAAYYLEKTVGDVPMLCLPADHLISGEKAVLAVYEHAIELALADDVIVTIGIKPSRPETGYGYIKSGLQVEEKRQPVYSVDAFVEKPTLEKAEEYLKSGNYYWNSGMFIMRPSVVINAIKEHLPDTAKKLGEISELFISEDAYQRAAELYAQIEPVSIDVGVMERASNVFVIPAQGFKWSDVGAWDSWVETLPADARDEHNNVVRGQGILVSSEDCAVVGGKKLIAAVGLKDIIIVDTDDALLVCNANHAQEVKVVVDFLKQSNREDLL